jgi:dipeptidyl aminopeptidase/acylaminoacyl peptidase
MSSGETEIRELPYGSWTSPITADVIAKGAVGFGQPWYDGHRLFWNELRPTEGGRSVVVCRDENGVIADITPPGFNARTRVHEYGGGDYVVAGDTVYFSNFADQRIHRQDRGAPPRPITPAAPLRYADYRFDERRDRLICVREDKRRIESREDVNAIVAVAIGGDDDGGHVLVSGNDFYSSPRISPDGAKLCWLTWNHPDMPWDAAELWVGSIAPDGSVVDRARVAGGAREAIFQPEWAPDGSLWFASDKTGFWNLYRSGEGVVEPLCERAAEFGYPQWVFGLAVYAFVAPHIALATYCEKGIWRLGKIDANARTLTAIDTPYTWFSVLRGAPGSAVLVAGSPADPAAIVRYDLATNSLEVIRRSIDLAIDRGDISIPEPIEFPTTNGRTAHAFYYRPQNRRFRGANGAKPPLLVKCHGGPTGATSTLFSLAVQYWTSRGFAVLDVNYGGSTGYGREYRERLDGQWGIVDVDDCAHAALYLSSRGEVDKGRMAISGGSAGGFTVLASMTTHDIFGAGASHYGVGDLVQLVEDGRAGHHKFESRYEERLVAPYPSGIDVYRARSPIQHTDRLSRPLIFFQGLDDKVVMPNQAEGMVEVLRQKHLPVAYLAFQGEGHGFRRAETIKRVLEAELSFYGRVFGFEIADRVEPLVIDNL